MCFYRDVLLGETPALSWLISSLYFEHFLVNGLYHKMMHRLACWSRLNTGLTHYFASFHCSSTHFYACFVRNTPSCTINAHDLSFHLSWKRFLMEFFSFGHRKHSSNVWKHYVRQSVSIFFMSCAATQMKSIGHCQGMRLAWASPSCNWSFANHYLLS